ncbi:lipopolysaccharide biosynthesis protein [Streptococcus equinus]|uniref:lipopolysaccharide biosynthesis protein n=1 Tax=Streptococcus equinus TaxID=1335 RepID=UPI00067B0A9E|nr:hypothetical protein [Streptococcus equinus]
MKLDRINNTFRNITSGLVNKVVTLLLPFLIRTVLIKTVGMEYAGLNSLFSSILQVLNLTELGFSSAVVYSMYKPIARNDTKQINALLAFYRKIYRIIGFVVLIIGLLLLPLLPQMVNGGYPNGINIYVLYIIYLFNTVVSYFLFAYKSAILNAHQRVDVASNILTVTQGLMNIVQILVLLAFKNYYCYIIWMPVFTIVNNLLTAHFTNKMFPQYHCEGKIDSEQLLDMKYKVGGLMVNKICLTTRNTFDSIFISAFLGLTVSAIYGNYYYIMTAVIGIISVISSSMLAGIGNSIQTDSVEKNYNDLKKFNFLYMWLSGWCAICMLCLTQPFMIIWMGEENLFPFGVVILLCLYFYTLKMGDMRSLYSEAAGLWWQNRYRAIFESVANLILNFVMVKIWGIYGIISATLITLFLINFVGGSGIVFKYYFKNKKLIEFLNTHLFYFVITVGNAILTFYVTDKVEISGIVGLLIKGVVCIIVPNIIYSIFYLRRKELNYYFQWFYEKLF